MSIPQSVADILDHHVTFELECIDRMYLNAYVPMLQCKSGIAKFIRFHRGHKFASSALMDPMTKVAAPNRATRVFRHFPRRISGQGQPCSLRVHNPAMRVRTAYSEVCVRMKSVRRSLPPKTSWMGRSGTLTTSIGLPAEL